MLKNFNDITPKAPTELPVDFDHLSMDPRKPGDGIAAGWMKQLELRDGGDTLYAEVEWTPTAAKQIAEKEYRFVSPSFVKDHIHKDGSKIGTTLLAAAITNHPFLEGMASLTLHNLSMMGELSADVLANPDTRAVIARWDLADVGQRVMIAPGDARTQDEVGGTFEVSEVVGDGDDQFISVKDGLGNIHKWFRATELLPASAVPANPAIPALPVPAGGAPAVPGVPVPGAPVVPGAVPGAPVVPGVPAATGAVPGAPAVPGAAVPAVPGADGVMPSDSKSADGKSADGKPADGEKKPNPFAKKGDQKTEGAAGADGTTGMTPEGAAAANTDAPKKDGKQADTMGDLDRLKQFLAALQIAAATGQPPPPPPKGISMKFTLRNDKNEPITVTSEQLAAAGITVVPEGHVAIPATEVSELKDTVKNLSTTVATMQTDSVNAQKAARTIELNTTLDRLSKGGFISKPTRDALFDQFKEALSLDAFRAICNTFTKPILNLDTEHGSGIDAETSAGDAATDKLINLTNQIVKERGLSLRDATIEAGKQLAGDAEAYREQFAEASR